jgi:DNA-binding CsgD family transcriptional regulator
MAHRLTGSAGEPPETWNSLVERAHGLLGVVASLAGKRYAPAEVGGEQAALDAALAWADQFLRVRGCQIPKPGGIDGPQLAKDLCIEVADLRNRLMVRTMASRQEMMQRVDQSLQRLRQATTVDEFTRQLPIEVVNLGYVRSLFSWADDNLRWVAQAAHSMQGSEESRRLVEAGQLKPFRNLRDYYEFEMIRDRRPILLRGISKSSQVHPELLKVTESESYVASPIIAGGSVVGFTSLDVNATSGTVDEFDRDLIGVFTVGAGIALDRLRMLPDADSHMHEGGGGLSQLTPREAEILQLIAAGCTNADIGRQLFISEGTAKTHVRNVLHKLGVSNRTQAAGIYRRSGSRS